MFLLNFVEIKTVKKIDGTSEAAIEAEVRAAKERALIPLEQRIKQFKEMLREKDVSILKLLFLFQNFKKIFNLRANDWKVLPLGLS